jgi:UV damage repair endonuclease
MILRYNTEHRIRFFRITSDIVPFASHEVCTYPWQVTFADQFALLGEYIRTAGMRISLHPDQFTLINSPDETIFSRSVDELTYHADLLNLLGLDETAKIQIHVGGVYKNREASLDRFVARYQSLDDGIRSHLVIENDERLFPVSDCLSLHEQTGIPVLLDTFHYSILNTGETIGEALRECGATWKSQDGVPMVDYSSQQPHRRPGVHAETLDRRHFNQFLSASNPYDIDIMLEIKDKEKSALQAVRCAQNDPRFSR